jgi:hypothetical protein
MYFITIVNKTNWVLEMLEKHAKERERKLSKKAKHGRGPIPVSTFKDDSGGNYSVPEEFASYDETLTHNTYFDEED